MFATIVDKLWGLFDLKFSVVDILRLFVFIAGWIDAYKYRWQAQKIRKWQSAKNISRKFTLTAILCDIIIIMYCVYLRDPILIIIRVISLFCMCELFWVIYLYYPYSRKKLKGFKRPSFFTYVINAMTPNSVRRHL